MKILGLLISIILLLSSCSKIESKEIKQFSENQILEVITQTIWWDVPLWKYSVIWEVFSDKESILSAKFPSDVVNIKVSIWSKVKAWDVLVETKSENIQIAYEDAKLAYSNALNTLSKTINSTNRSIESSKIAYENSKSASNNTSVQIDLQKKQALQSLNTTKTSSKLSVESAEQALNNILDNSQKSEELAKNNLDNAIENSKIIINNTINDLDKILWFNEINKSSADTYNSYLWAFDITSITNARDSYQKSLNMAWKINYSDISNILAILSSLKNSTNANIELLKKSTTWMWFSDTELKSLINFYNWVNSSIQNTITSLTSYKKSLDSTITTNKSSIESAKKALAQAKQEEWWSSQSIELAEDAYKVNVQSLENTLDTVQNNAAASRSAYEWTKELAKLQIAQVKSQADMAKSNLNNAQIRLDDLTIRAPFDWEVVDIYVDNGDEISAWINIIKIKNSNADFKIVAFLTKAQTKWIWVWDMIWIWEKSMDKISSISSVLDPITKKYKIEIRHSNPFLHAWQFVNLSFTPKNLNTDINNSAIFIPLNSIFVTSDWNYVWIYKNWVSEKKNINLWEISWDTIEITSWLNNWDKVIISWWRSIKANWEKLKEINLNAN